MIAAAVLLLTDAGQNTDLGNTIRTTIDSQIQSIKDFINQNTQ